MKIHNWDDLPQMSLAVDITGGKKTALTIGVFDGLHRGHQALISKITAKSPDLLPAVITFREKPRSPAGTTDIITFKEKLILLENLGVDLCLVIDFSEHFSTISGRVFLETLNRYLCPAYIVVGTNFHCGYRRDTDAGGFKKLAEGLRIETEIVVPVMEGGLPVSSSRIRKALESGRAEEAALLLGRSVE
ncbi:MAG: FAD synthetase family protein [Treponema sp.]|nr:FAD synthetase family protein [Treponema sp.]